MKKWYLITIIFVGIIFLQSSFVNLDTEVERLREMNECFLDKQIPCRWIKMGEYGYGSPFFNYHPPLPFYFGQFLYTLIANFDFSAKFVYITPFLVSIIFIWTLFRFSKSLNISNMLFMSISIVLLITSSNRLTIIFLLLPSLWVVIVYLIERKWKFILLPLYSVIIAIFLSSFYLLPSIFERNLLHSNKLKNEALDYLPIFANEIPKSEAKEKFQILTGDSEVYDFKQGSNWLSFKTNTRTHTIIRLSQFYFPNWKIFIDGKEAEFEYKNNSLGLVTIILGEGNHFVEGKLYDTAIRKISNIATLATVTLFFALFLMQIKVVKKWIAYYRKGIS